MLTSLALVFLLGLAAAALCSRIGLPRIIGMLLTGILIGPYVLNWLDDSILSISSELRQMALIIILLKAGLSLNLSDLRQVGRPAVLLSCLPATCELAGYILLAPYLLGVNRIEAAVMGAVLAAVSPAVVVPRMVFLMENRWGTDKSIPKMLLAGASCDDIYVIVLFTTFTGIAQGGNARAADFLNIPVSVVLGIAVGAAGVVLCLAGTKLSRRERLFCVIAYLPKATVQAAIGSVPLAMGLPCGKIVLSVAVLAILITAPLGALGMDAAYRKLLKYEG